MSCSRLLGFKQNIVQVKTFVYDRRNFLELRPREIQSNIPELEPGGPLPLIDQNNNTNCELPREPSGTAGEHSW